MQNAQRHLVISMEYVDLLFLCHFIKKKKKQQLLLLLFLIRGYVFPYRNYRKRFIASVADSGSSLSETVKFTLCLEENASSAV